MLLEGLATERKPAVPRGDLGVTEEKTTPRAINFLSNCPLTICHSGVNKEKWGEKRKSPLLNERQPF